MYDHVQQHLYLRTTACKLGAACINQSRAKVRYPLVSHYRGGASGHLTTGSLSIIRSDVDDDTLRYCLSDHVQQHLYLRPTACKLGAACIKLSPAEARYILVIHYRRSAFGHLTTGSLSIIRSDVNDNTLHYCLSDHVQQHLYFRTTACEPGAACINLSLAKARYPRYNGGAFGHLTTGPQSII